MDRINLNIKNNHLQIFSNIVSDDVFGMPVINKYKGEIPTKLQAFNKAVTQKEYSNTVHFYLNDKEFARILTYPEKYLEILKRFKSVIAPDFSQYIDMPLPMRFYHCFLNKALAAYWANKGVNVIITSVKSFMKAV